MFNKIALTVMVLFTSLILHGMEDERAVEQISDIETYLVKLKNGSEEEAPIVNAIMHAIYAIKAADEPKFLLIELKKKAQINTYILADAIAEKLKQLSLLKSDGTIADSVRNVILSAIQEKSSEFSIDDPTVKEEYFMLRFYGITGYSDPKTSSSRKFIKCYPTRSTIVGKGDGRFF